MTDTKGGKAVQRRFPDHLDFIRKHECSARRIWGCGGVVEAAHVDDEDRIPPHERKGMQMKTHDKWTYPLCTLHHRQSHAEGHDAFDRRAGIDRFYIAQVLAARSPARHQWESADEAE